MSVPNRKLTTREDFVPVNRYSVIKDLLATSYFFIHKKLTDIYSGGQPSAEHGSIPGNRQGDHTMLV